MRLTLEEAREHGIAIVGAHNTYYTGIFAHYIQMATREGLIAIAVGVLWLTLAEDRRSRALARIVLGAGLMAFGLQTFRPGFEALLQDATLLEFLSKLRADGVLHSALCALLGAFLVALLQGPAPVIVLVILIDSCSALLRRWH